MKINPRAPLNVPGKGEWPNFHALTDDALKGRISAVASLYFEAWGDWDPIANYPKWIDSDKLMAEFDAAFNAGAVRVIASYTTVVFGAPLVSQLEYYRENWAQRCRACGTLNPFYPGRKDCEVCANVRSRESGRGEG